MIAQYAEFLKYMGPKMDPICYDRDACYRDSQKGPPV